MQQNTYAFLDQAGEMGALTRAFEWSRTPLGEPGNWPQSLRTMVSTVLHSKFPMLLWWGEELIQFYNDAYRPSLGNNGKHPSALGQRGKECWPEIWPIISPLIKQVQQSQQATWMEDQLVPIYRNGSIEDVYWTYSYSPVFGDDDRPAGILVTCMETTGKVNSLNELTRTRKETEQRENNLRNIVLQAPVAMCILRGPQYVIEIANRLMLEIWGKANEHALYKPMFEALPEAANQGYETLLDKVSRTGEGFAANELPITLPRGERLENMFINLVLEPIREIDGTVSGVLGMATDITGQVRARKKVEEAEERMRLSLEAADLGSFEANLLTSEVLTSARFDAIFDIAHSAKHQQYLQMLHPDDLPLREKAYQQAFETGLLEYEARVVWNDGSVHWVGVWGNVYFDEAHKPVRLQGVVQEITAQKEFAAELGRQVHERTLALEIKNKELERSNANLEEFAHAASHDLKEPIRKIHYFTSRLKDRLQNRLNEEEAALFAPIERSTERMSELIDDLLLYSHVSQRPHKKESVDLNIKLHRVLEDLELDIQQKGALVQAGPLPIVSGYRRQLQQLFHNLITNALKYSKAGITPRIRIASSQVSAHEAGLPGDDPYHLIEFRDNGIGFEQEYAEKIFHMFTRLHGKNDYSGTGVGLSIAKKVVENHGGYISAEGMPEEGAVFKIYLPVG